MEHTSDIVYDGKLLHETSYPYRAKRYEEISLDGIKIDYFDPKTNTVHEIKRSNSLEDAHRLQLKYYMFRLKNIGIHDVKGILEYPLIRKTEKVELLPEDEAVLLKSENDILRIVDSNNCPEKIIKNFCKKCAYYDFCWIGEDAS